MNFDHTDINTAQHILVVNRGQAPAAVTVQKQSFTSAADGSLDFQDDAPYSASNWVTIDPVSFDVAPGQTQTVTANVSMPAAPDPGDHQMGLVFLVPSTQTSGNIKINRGIGMPVYITVPGPTVDAVSLTDLTAPEFATGGPVAITATMHNTGTVHHDFRAPSPLTLDVAGTPQPFRDFTVPRDSIRDISTTWDPPLLCICNPAVTLTDADGTTHRVSVQVIVFPIQLAAIVLGALLLLIFGVWFFRRRYRANVTKAALALHRPVGRGDA